MSEKRRLGGKGEVWRTSEAKAQNYADTRFISPQLSVFVDASRALFAPAWHIGPALARTR